MASHWKPCSYKPRSAGCTRVWEQIAHVFAVLTGMQTLWDWSPVRMDQATARDFWGTHHAVQVHLPLKKFLFFWNQISGELISLKLLDIAWEYTADNYLGNLSPREDLCFWNWAIRGLAQTTFSVVHQECCMVTATSRKMLACHGWQQYSQA